MKEESEISRKFTGHKADKKKGRKCRLDELQQAEKEFLEAYERDLDGKYQAATCRYKEQGHRGRGWGCYHGWGDSLKYYRRVYEKLYSEAVADGII